MYDIIVLGGGIAGLYTAIYYSRKQYSVILCEKYKTLGGRVETYHHDNYSWESGAARISESHTLVRELIKRYHLNLAPINSKLAYKKDGASCIEPNLFEPSLKAMVTPLHDLDSKVLATHTLKELLVKVHGFKKAIDYLYRFPYKAETEVLRADLALHTFKNEMGSHDGYYICTEGLSALIDCMKKEYESYGGVIMTESTCLNIIEKENSLTAVFSKGSLDAKHIVCALTSEALKQIPYFKNLEVLKKVVMKPLLRTYAVYPTPAWFAQLPSVVSAGPIRYFIPIDYAKGIAMVSYTDSQDTVKYHKSKNLEKKVIQDLKELFGDVPNYKYFKSHYWRTGATYWLPGNYNPIEESDKSIKPFDANVYIVGESFSLRQAWMEGALEQCIKLFKLDILV